MPDKVENFREIDGSKNRPRARPGFAKSIPNGLRKMKYLIERRPLMTETDLARKENGIRLQKEE